MTSGEDIKPPSMLRRAMQYLIVCIVILLLLGLLVTYWPAALVIAVISGVIWWRKKAPHEQITNIMTTSTPIAGNNPQPIQPVSTLQPMVTPPVSTPVIAIEYSINRKISRPTTPGTNELQWSSYEDILEIATYRIEHPMTYWAPGKTRIAEASCIEKHLPVGKPASESRGALGYWPRYENMTPSQRGNYLSWLAAGKQGQLEDIGYAFVYFYGLERRVLIDDKDINLILPETARLLRSYPESGSFSLYLSRFIAFAAARTGLKSITKDIFTLCFEHELQKPYSEDLLAVILCWFYQHDLPLPAHWALEIARQDIRTTHSVIINRVPEQFKTLFIQKYQKRFSDGMKLKVADRERLLDYHPASPSLSDLGYSSTTLVPVRIPNVMGLQSQFVPLVQIWNLCIEELREYSRVVGKGVDITKREAWEALPPELRRDMDHPDAARWEEVATAYVREDGFSLTPLSKLAEIQGFEQRERLTPTQSKALAQTANDTRLAIVPDARITGRSYIWSDEVVLFRQESDVDLQQKGSYRAAACMLELGMVIAGADGIIDQEEIDHIEQSLEDQFHLSPYESRHLKAYGLLLSKNPPSITSLSKPLRAALTPDQRALIGKYLVGVAATNGIIDRKEISALKSIYKSLNADVSELDALLVELYQPPIVQMGSSEVYGEVIPSKPEIPLNHEVVKRLRMETEDIHTTLADILDKTESEILESGDIIEDISSVDGVDLQLKRANLPFSDEQLTTLNINYHAPFEELLKKQAWSSDELAELASRYHIKMFGGMIAAINTWAIETLDDEILIEDENKYTINRSIIEAQV